MTAAAIANGYLTEKGEIQQKSAILNEKPSKKNVKKSVKCEGACIPVENSGGRFQSVKNQSESEVFLAYR